MKLETVEPNDLVSLYQLPWIIRNQKECFTICLLPLLVFVGWSNNPMWLLLLLIFFCIAFESLQFAIERFMQLFEISAYPRTKPIFLPLPAWHSSGNTFSLSFELVYVCTIIRKWRYKRFVTCTVEISPTECHRIIRCDLASEFTVCICAAIIVFHLLYHTLDSIFSVCHFHTNKTKRKFFFHMYVRITTAAFHFLHCCFGVLFLCSIIAISRCCCCFLHWCAAIHS